MPRLLPRSRLLFLGLFTLIVILSLGALHPSSAQEKGKEALPAPGELPNLVHVEPAPVVGHVVEPMIVNLASARAYALHHHPTLKAYHASLVTARRKLRALEKLCLAPVVRRDLPIRKQQAQKGVLAMEAQLRQAQWDVLYGATRMYFTAVYAMEQIRVAERALDPERIDGIRKLRELLLDPKDKKSLREDLRRDLKEWDKDHVEVVIKAAEARLVEAKVGQERAIAGLREAMGLEAECLLMVDPNDRLAHIVPAITRDHVVALAKMHRGEIIQAQIAYDLMCLEIVAQGKIYGLSAQTFAAGGDIHARPVPIGEADGDYRPGAIAIEMPTTLVGHRQDRQSQVRSLKVRAGAVIDKTRHLVTLQAEDTFLKWKQAVEEIERFEAATKQAAKVGKTLGEKFDPAYRPPGRNLPVSRPDRPTLIELLNANIRAINLKLRTNQSRYQALISLVGIERATAGGIQPGFDHPLPYPAEVIEEKKDDANGDEDKDDAANKDDTKVNVPDLILP